MTILRRTLALVAGLTLGLLVAASVQPTASARTVDERCAGHGRIPASALARRRGPRAARWSAARCTTGGSRSSYRRRGSPWPVTAIGTHGEVRRAAGLQHRHPGRAPPPARPHDPPARHARAGRPERPRPRGVQGPHVPPRGPHVEVLAALRGQPRARCRRAGRRRPWSPDQDRQRQHAQGPQHLRPRASRHPGRPLPGPHHDAAQHQGRRPARSRAARFNTTNVVGFGNLPGDLLGWTCYWWVGTGRMGAADIMLDNGNRLVTDASRRAARTSGTSRAPSPTSGATPTGSATPATATPT